MALRIRKASELQAEETGEEFTAKTATAPSASRCWRSALAVWLFRLAVRLEASSIRSADVSSGKRPDGAVRGGRTSHIGKRPW